MSVFYKPKVYEVPSEGPHTFCVTNVTDLGEGINRWGEEKHMLRFDFIVDELSPTTGQPLPADHEYNMVGGEQSRLLPLYRALTGLKNGFIPVNFEFDTLIGRNFRGSITHSVKPDGRVFANVGKDVFAANPNVPPLTVPANYVKVAHRKSTAFSNRQNPPELEAKVQGSIRSAKAAPLNTGAEEGP